MPIYTFLCQDCENKFDLLIRKKHQERFCPECKSEDLRKNLSFFSISGGSKSSSSCNTCSGGSCSTCS